MASNLQIKVGVIGASGYSGGELLRILAGHPNFQPIYMAAGSNAGEPIVSVHPHLLSEYGEALFAATEIEAASECELLFIALPHGQSANLVNQLPAGIKIVDLGADFRLSDAQAWSKYYGGEHAGSLVYALPELPGARAVIAQAERVANPGCYATSIILGALPAIAHQLLDELELVVVSASGTTGAGRSAKINLIASEVMGSLSSYKFGGAHQHTPEIEQALSKVAGKSVTLNFTPILAPMPRGILTTISARLSAAALEHSDEYIYEIYREFFGDEFFVKVLPVGMMPNTNAVNGSNFVHLQVAVDRHAGRVCISVAIDNLGKGAASQAVQNANLLFALPESTGLTITGVRP